MSRISTTFLYRKLKHLFKCVIGCIVKSLAGYLIPYVNNLNRVLLKFRHGCPHREQTEATKEYDSQEDFITHEKEVTDAMYVLRVNGCNPRLDHIALDLGGGHGMHSGFLSNLFSSVYCTDVINYTTLYDGNFCKRIADKHIAHKVSIYSERIQFVQMDAMEMIFRDDFFDFCFCFNAFEHIQNPKKALDEIIRVLKPGAFAYVTFDPIWTADTGSHFSHVVPDPWAHLVLSDNDFIEQMRKNRSTNYDINEYSFAMNRWRYSQYMQIFDNIVIRNAASIVFFDEYSGFSSEGNKQHQNFDLAQQRGYSISELSTRRLRWIVRKNDRRENL